MRILLVEMDAATLGRRLDETLLRRDFQIERRLLPV